MSNTCNAKKVYDHKAKPWRPDPQVPGQLECRVCGIPVYGYDPDTLLHRDELPRARFVPVKAADAAAVRAVAASVRDTLDALHRLGRHDQMPTDAVADIIARELYALGSINSRVSDWSAAA